MLVYTLGDEVNPHGLGNKILNTRGTVPQCYGNESHIDDCNNMPNTECSPVLVDCGTMASLSQASSSDNRHSGNNVILYIVAVTVSLLLVAQAVVCAVIIRVWKKGLLFR